MGLSPRKVNEYIKGRMRERGIQVPRNQHPEARDSLNLRRVPTERLIARLDLSRYDGLHASDDCLEIHPDRIFVPFSQHIGKPAQPSVKWATQCRRANWWRQLQPMGCRPTYTAAFMAS